MGGGEEGKTFEFLEVALDGSGAAGTRHGNVEFVIIGVGHFTSFFLSFFFLLFRWLLVGEIGRVRSCEVQIFERGGAGGGGERGGGATV